MKQWLTLVIISMLMLGGCSGVDKKKQGDNQFQDTIALQDEFTREFIKSPKEVEDGYYLFESKTGGYTMWFPVNANMDQSFYHRRDDKYEEINFGETIKSKNLEYFVVGRYEDKKSTKLIDINLEMLAKSNGYEGNFEKYTLKDNTIYYAEKVEEINENQFIYVYFSYIVSNNTNKAISITYSSTCSNKDSKCTLNRSVEREKAKKLFHSIKFVK